MNRTRIALSLGTVLLAGSAGAAQLDYGIEAGVGNSDNIRRVPTGEESETMLTAGLDLAWLRDQGRFRADVDLDLSWVDYQDGAYDSEVTGLAHADFRMLFVPGRFEWMLVDSFGQAEIDPFSASTPDNRENINYFTTGPDFTVRLGSVASLTLFGRYSATEFEDSNFDDDRLLGGISIGRELNRESGLSLNVTAERVEFDDPTAGSDYDRQSAYLRYEIQGSRTRIAAEAGFTQIKDDFETHDSPLIELDIVRNLSERSTLSFRGGIRSSDAASALRTGAELGGGVPIRPGPISTTEPFETRGASLGWQYGASRTEFAVSAGHEEDVYETTSLLDSERQHYEASARRQISARFSARVRASLFKTQFSMLGQEDDETQYGLYLSWNPAGRLFVEADVEKFERDSSNPLTDFDEVRAFLRFVWRSTGGPGAAR